MLKKKILSLVAGSLLVLANSCSATNLISMGPVSLIVPADTVTNDLITPKFDTDSIQVDKAAHTVDVLIFITPSPYNHYDEYRIERLKLFKDASQSTAHVLRVRYYERGTDKLIGDYNRGGYSLQMLMICPIVMESTISTACCSVSLLTSLIFLTRMVRPTQLLKI